MKRGSSSSPHGIGMLALCDACVNAADLSTHRAFGCIWTELSKPNPSRAEMSLVGAAVERNIKNVAA